MLHLAILRVKSDASEEKQASLRKDEAAMVWKMICADSLRSIHFIPGPGVVLHLETRDTAEAESSVRQLPMVRNGVVSVEVIPLKPFDGLQALFKESP